MPSRCAGSLRPRGTRLKSSPDKFGYGARLAAALLALDAKQYDTAGEFFDLALAAKPKQTDEVFMVWGVGLLTGDRAAEAAKVFQRAIDEKALPDDNPIFYFYLAGALALDGRTDDALAAARTAAEKKKDSARFRGRAAWVLYVAKRYDEAMKAYRELIDEFDADHDSAETRDVLREARLALSNLARHQGRHAAGRRMARTGARRVPRRRGRHERLGLPLGRPEQKPRPRERMIQKAVDAEPDNMAYRDSLGWVLFRLGKYPRGRGRVGKGRRRQKARRRGPRSSRRRLPKGRPPRQGHRGMAQGGGTVAEGKGNGEGRCGGEEDLQIKN